MRAPRIWWIFAMMVSIGLAGCVGVATETETAALPTPAPADPVAAPVAAENPTPRREVAKGDATPPTQLATQLNEATHELAVLRVTNAKLRGALAQTEGELQAEKAARARAEQALAKVNDRP